MHAVLERVVCQIANEVSGLDAETTQLHPNGLAYKWSAQEVVEHLVLGYRLTTERSRDPAEQRAPFPQPDTHLSAMVAAADDPQFRSSAPGSAGAGGDDARPGALCGHERAAAGRSSCARKSTPWTPLLDRCRRKFGMERVATHPLLGALRVDQWRRFHVVHGLHHLTQLRSVIEQVAPAPGSAQNDQQESSEKTADTSPASAGLEKCCTARPG